MTFKFYKAVPKVFHVMIWDSCKTNSQFHGAAYMGTLPVQVIRTFHSSKGIKLNFFNIYPKENPIQSSEAPSPQL